MVALVPHSLAEDPAVGAGVPAAPNFHGMAAVAMGLPAIWATTANVFPWRDSFQVVWVDAVAHSAKVVDRVPVRDDPTSSSESHAVRIVRTPVDTDAPISSTVVRLDEHAIAHNTTRQASMSRVRSFQLFPVTVVDEQFPADQKPFDAPLAFSQSTRLPLTVCPEQALDDWFQT